jgi:uncharacterized protein (DUF169 family)
MTLYADLADRLEAALGVTNAVGIRILRDPDVVECDGGGPEASCVHWTSVLTSGQAARTTASEHAGCSVGSYVHGMSTLEQAAGAEDTALLVSAGWVKADALADLPTLPEGIAGIDYLPLREVQGDPDLVLFSVTPEQLMAVHAAIPALRLTGKPQCQFIPLAAQGTPCASLGCAVSRARTGADPGEMTCALPTLTLVEVLGELEAASTADRAAAESITTASPDQMVHKVN